MERRHVAAANTDREWMKRALSLARKGYGRTSPNPLVGAVVVRDGAEVGKGWHRRAGEPHAEPIALRKAGSAARGSTLYVTLEPCSTFGRTPPCTESILEAGIGRVAVGCRDPNPCHAGRGLERLREAGLEVTCGVLEERCLRLNEAFFWWIRHQRPFVALKMAMTLDGRIATASGHSRWITEEPARRYVQRLRQWSDAIMIGGETVLLDDPALTVRSPRSWPCQPRVCVWTSRELPDHLRIFREHEGPPICAKPEGADQWRRFLQRLAAENITALLIEGGGELAAAALTAGAVNKVCFFIAPKILGGRTSRPVVGGPDPARLSEAMELRNVRTRRVGPDTLITGYCQNVHGID